LVEIINVGGAEVGIYKLTALEYWINVIGRFRRCTWRSIQMY